MLNLKIISQFDRLIHLFLLLANLLQSAGLFLNDLLTDTLSQLVIHFYHLDLESAYDWHMLISQLFNHIIAGASDIILSRVPDAVRPTGLVRFEATVNVLIRGQERYLWLLILPILQQI